MVVNDDPMGLRCGTGLEHLADEEGDGGTGRRGDDKRLEVKGGGHGRGRDG